MSIEISVIIPVYNAEKYVIKAVKSVLQFPEVKEILLIEDGSPDNALEVCRQLEKQYTRIKLLQHADKGNHGAGASRNLGLMHASCPYIAFLDADDFYLPNRFDVDKRIFSENLQVDGVYNALGIYYYSKHAERIYKSITRQEITTVTEYIDSIKLFESFIGLRQGAGYFSLDGLTIRKEILEKLEYWFNPELQLHQDTEFMIRLAYTAQLVPGEIRIPTVQRGVHGQNRITSIQFDDKKKDLHQKKLWNSLYNWAKKHEILEKYLHHLHRVKVIKNLPTYNYFYRWAYILVQFIKDRNLIFDVKYYNSIHYLLFGNNRISYLLLRAKNKIHRVITHHEFNNIV